MGEKRDETPFASLLGERLSSVEFVLNDYVQLRFDGPTLNAYSHPVVTVAGRTFRWGETGYRDALCERILAVVRAAWAAPEEIVIQLGDDSTIAVSNRVEDVMGAEAAELSTPNGLGCGDLESGLNPPRSPGPVFGNEARRRSATVERMTIQRMDHVGIVVDDLAAATAFFVELGLELQGETPAEGEWVDRIVGLEGIRVDTAMMETPDGNGRLELVKFHAPSGPDGDRDAPANTPGLRHLAFAVDDIDAAIAGLRAHGGELVGEVESYKDIYRLCYLRGPEGIIVELAERIG